MFRARLGRVTGVWLILAAAAAVLHAAGDAPDAPEPRPTADSNQLVQGDPVRALEVGRLLVATPRVGDPSFAQTVVLLFAHADKGTGGLILNRPTLVPVARAMPDLPVPGAAALRVFFGGPVSTAEVRGLLRGPVAGPGSPQVLPGVHLLASREAVDAAAADGVGGDRLRLYAGYAGWGQGQLEREIRRGDWHVLEGDQAVIFDTEPESLWRRQLRLTEVLAA